MAKVILILSIMFIGIQGIFSAYIINYVLLHLLIVLINKEKTSDCNENADMKG